MTEVERLSQKLKEAESELYDLESQQDELENRIVEIKEKIKKLQIQKWNQYLPTDLLYLGFQLYEQDKYFFLKDRTGETLNVWPYVPTLGDLFDAKRILLEAK